MVKRFQIRKELKQINLQKVGGIKKLGPGSVAFIKDQCDCEDATFCDCDEKPVGSRFINRMKVNTRVGQRIKQGLKKR